MRAGLGILSQEEYGYLFDDKDITTDTRTLDEKILWFQTVRRARENYNDPNDIIDMFSVEGPLRNWIGISK